MVFRLRHLGPIACAAMVLQAAPATAEPVQITGGTLTVAGQTGSPDFTLVGTGFLVMGGGDAGSTGPALCEPCTAGDIVSFDSLYSGSSLGAGPAIINGVTYPWLYYSGQFEFEGEEVSFPEGSGHVAVTSRFAFPTTPGRLPFMQGYLDSARIGTPVFSTRLTGTGTAIASYFQFFDQSDRFSFRDVTYVFGPSPSPIPEPALLSLVGAALAGLGARRWRRRRSAPPRRDAGA